MEATEEKLISGQAEPDEYMAHFLELVELERHEEMAQQEAEIRRMSGRQRELAGRAILRLRGRDDGEGLGGYKVKFMRKSRGEQLPDTTIFVGDLVMVSKQSPYRDDNPIGTVAEVSNYAMTVVFRDEPPGFVYGYGLRIDLVANDITYRRMEDAVRRLCRADARLGELREVLLGQRPPAAPEPPEITDWHNPRLNDSQRHAVRLAMGSPDVHLIHGPPGTGKTTTLVEVVCQAHARGQSILVCAPSNVAVDNVLERLVDAGLEALRIGHPVRVTPMMREHTLDERVEHHPSYIRAQRLREEAFALKEDQSDLVHPSGRYRRGMSNKKIKWLADKGRSARGVEADTIEAMAAWIAIQDEVEAKFAEADRLREEAIDALIDAADVVLTTNASAGGWELGRRSFDLVVVDEATQASEPSALIPIVHGRHVVLAGDHRQLPPVIKNLEAARGGLSVSLFERLASRVEAGLWPGLKSLLTVQYRMHETIMGFSSEAFYEGKLDAAPGVGSHTLADLDFDPSRLPDALAEVLAADCPVVFVDTAAVDAAESQRADSTSRQNRWEAHFVSQLARACLSGGLDPRQVAVIAPYVDQVDLIWELLGVDHLEVKTVDGFQGREKEVILISLTRSNPDGEVGFLSDVRRFNVAITRARRKLVVIGDSTTVASHQTYADFLAYVEQHGRIVQPEI